MNSTLCERDNEDLSDTVENASDWVALKRLSDSKKLCNKISGILCVTRSIFWFNIWGILCKEVPVLHRKHAVGSLYSHTKSNTPRNLTCKTNKGEWTHGQTGANTKISVPASVVSEYTLTLFGWLHKTLSLQENKLLQMFLILACLCI